MPSNQFIGKSYELLVAKNLTEKGIIVSMPLIDNGADLIATNQDFTKVVPIQVKKKEHERNIFFKGKEIEQYKNRNIYIAYFLRDSSWYIPFDDGFLQMATITNRRDQAGYISISDNANNEELLQYKDENGFNKLVSIIMPHENSVK